MKTRQYIIIGALIILMLVLSGVISNVIKSSKKESPKTPIENIKRVVRTQKIEYGEIKTFVRETGRIISQQTVDVITEVQGILLKGDVPLKKGQKFIKGDLLFSVFDEDASYLLQSRKSRFLNSLASMLPDLKVDYPESYNKLKYNEHLNYRG